MKKTTLSAAIALAFMVSAPVWASDVDINAALAKNDSVANTNTENEQEKNSGAQAMNNSEANVDNREYVAVFAPKTELKIKDSGNTTVEAKTVLKGKVEGNSAFQGNIAKGGSADAHADGGESGKAMAMSMSGAESDGGKGGSAFSGAGAKGDADSEAEKGKINKSAALGVGAAKSTANGGAGGASKAGSVALAAATSGTALGGLAIAKATGGNAGTYFVSNCISGSYSTGISNISQNNGANSLIQQGVTVQANLAIH